MGDIPKSIKGLIAAVAVLAGSLAFGGIAIAGMAQPGDTFPISYFTPPPNSVPGSPSGTMGPGYVGAPTSADGRYVFFASESDNLVPGADLELSNLFRKDTQTGDVVQVNLRADGSTILDYIYNFEASGDGNKVVMVTPDKAVPADADDRADVYLRDIAAGTTTLLTPGTAEDAYEVDISADGKFAVFSTSDALSPGDGNASSDVYRLRLSDGVMKIVSAINGTTTAGNGQATAPSISGDGTWVAFSSYASNLTAGFSDGNGAFDYDVFVRNVDTNATHLVSSRYNSPTVSANGSSEEPEIAGSPAALADVNVAYTSYGTNLTDNATTDSSTASSVYYKEMPGTNSELISRATGVAGANADSRAHTPTVSDDGSRIVYASDATNLGAGDDYYGIYLRDRGTSATSLVSAHNSYAVESRISGDGTTATWVEDGDASADADPDLPAVFSRKLPADQIKLVSRPKGNQIVRAGGFSVSDEQDRRVSANGRYVVFTAYSKRLPDTPANFAEQVYRRDLETGEIELVSRADGAAGAPAEGASIPTVSSDGNIVAFRAYSSLDPADPDGKADVYVRNMTTKETTLVSRADGPDGAVADDYSEFAEISGDGNRVVFKTRSSNLGTPGTSDAIFVRDIAAGKTIVVSRATGEAGDIANGNSGDPSLSFDGSRVVFTSYATNLSPDDPSNSQSIYVRNLNGNETLLVSREPGPAGASLSGYTYGPTISGNGARVAFASAEPAAVPGVGSWSMGDYQVVVRDIGDGTNRLASVTSSNQAGDGTSDNATLSRDGGVIAFDTQATNLRDGFSSNASSNVIVRNLETGVVTGSPSFGTRIGGNGYASQPAISDNGECVIFSARGHNDVSGDLGDIYSLYMLAVGGSCLDPQAIVPSLSAVSLKPAKFRVAPKPTAKVAAARKKKRKAPRGTKIRFTLNVPATVTFQIDRKAPGRKAGKKCVKPTRKNKRKKACLRYLKVGKLTRKDLAAGKRVVPFSGRIGKKALKPGRYRVVLQAVSPAGSSVKAYASFKVVKK